MTDLECIDFLQKYMPKLRFRWAGFRRVHKQVCKRLGRRVTELGLPGLTAYNEYLGDHQKEWRVLDSLLRVTISRFYRDRGVFGILGSSILPSLARDIVMSGGNELRCWSAGCCSGEEPYTLQILWKLHVIPGLHRDLPLRIIATDIDSRLLKRAMTGTYSEGSLRYLPEELVRQAFTRSGTKFAIKKQFTENIEFREQDIREQSPEGFFHLILCRNLAFTYFDEALQRNILERIAAKLYHGGVLVVGVHESVPNGAGNIIRDEHAPGIYKKQ